MSISTAGTLGTFSDKTARTRATFRMNAVSGGTYCVMIVSFDGGVTNAQSITDSSGNTWRVAAWWDASNGAETAMFFTRSHGTSITTSGTYGVQFGAAVTSKAFVGWKFSGTSGSYLSVTGSSSLTDTGADPGPMDLLVGNSHEYLWIRGIAHEGVLVAFTKTVAYDAAFGRANTSGGAAASNMGAYGEWDIRTGISADESDPTMSAVDHSSLLVAIREIEPPTGPTTSPKMEPALIVRNW